MKNRKSQLGLSILAGGLSFVGTAGAVDIVVDGSYESAMNNLLTPIIGLGGAGGPILDNGWTPFTTYAYSAGYTQADPPGSGSAYLRPYGDRGGGKTVSQINSLTRALTPAQIDGSQGIYSFSAWFCTYKNQNDYSTLTLQFMDESMNPVGPAVNLGGAAFVAALPPAAPMRAWGKDAKSGLVPATARYASLSSTSVALVGSADGYIDLVSLDVTVGFTPLQLTSAAPPGGASGVSPDAAPTVTLQDGTPALDNHSVVLWFDDAIVTPTIQKSGGTSTVSYQPPGYLASRSTHTYQIAYNNLGGAVANTTNRYQFAVVPYANIDLGPPLYLETFDSLAEGELPAGWSVQNQTDFDIAYGDDYNNFHSDAFLNWVVVDRASVSNWASVDGGQDFAGIFNVAPGQVYHQTLVTNLITDKFIIAVASRTSNQLKEIDYLYTGDYDLRGKTNVYLAFNNIYIQNQNNLGAVEYSINGGATWLPALYLLDPRDILRDGDGNIDAYHTFGDVHGDVPNAAANTPTNGYYGQFIGVASNLWSGLAPYLAARTDDDQTNSMRVEVVRLAQADNQPAVRFRLAMAGTYAWYFGIDNFGLYSPSGASAPELVAVPAPAAQTVAVGNPASLDAGLALGLGPMVYQWRRDGANLAGKTAQVLVIPVVSLADAGAYDVVLTGAGGAVTSVPPAAVLTVINPAVFVTGQWDFLNGDLTATCGRDMEYYDLTSQADTSFGSSASFGLPDLGGMPTPVMHFTPSVARWGGYKLHHGAAPNGNGAYVNQYTLIFDIYYPPGSDGTWRSLWQTGTGNSNDGDIFVSPENGIGISGRYDGFVSGSAWHRIAIGIDLAGPEQAPMMTKFIDGVKVGSQTAGLEGKDERLSLDSYALAFADNDGDVGEAYVSSIQFSNGRRPDAFIKALGGPSPLKIPGVIRVDRLNGNVVIRWTGGVPLQSADSPAGPWAVVPGTAGQYTHTPSPLATAKFYRPQIP